MTLEQFIESEAQRLFAALGARHGRDIDFYRLLARGCIAPTPKQLKDAMHAMQRVEEFLARGPVHICYEGMEGMEHLSLPRCKKSQRRTRRKPRATKGAPRNGAKPH